MNTFLDSHFAVTTVLYPLVNLIALGFLLFGVARTPLRRPFAILSAATILFLVPQMLNLLYFMKKTFDLTMLNPSTVRVLFPIQAGAEYVAFALDVWGVIMLVLTAKKMKPE